MRVRSTLTLFIALIAALTTGPAQLEAQGAAPSEPSDSAALVVGHPRSAVLSVFDSAAESFPLPIENAADSPVRLTGRGTRVRLAADYEAVFLPLTAGWARYRLAAYRVADGQPSLLDDDAAEVVAFGPERRAGRLGLSFELDPGLHQLRLVSEAAARAVGVPDWTTDRDAVTLWVLVSPGSVQPAPVLAPPLEVRELTLLSADIAPAAPDQSTDQPIALPVGGLSVGSQRGIAGREAIGAVNFADGHDRTLVTRVGQPMHVWSDYELWLADGAEASGDAVLSVRHRDASGAADVAPIARDTFGFTNGVGPRLEDGTLGVAVSFDQPGVYPLTAHLVTAVRRGDLTAQDRDVVPFTVRVVGEPPTTGAIAGRVYGEDGLALEGVTVEATDRNGAPVAKARTNARGHYRIEALAPGAYYVHAVPGALNYLAAWWQDSPTLRDATPVKVEAGHVSDGIHFKLTPGGTITGRVTDASGAGLGGIEIAVGRLRDAATPDAPIGTNPNHPNDADLSIGHARTNDDGYYSIDRLAAGPYWVRASDPAGRYLTEYYDDKLSFGQADKVPVEAGHVTGGIDFTLQPGGAITGQVLEQTTLTVIIPLPEISVEARDADDPTQVIARAVTNREGRYKLDGLRPGRILVRAADPNGRYVAEWFEEAQSPADARPVPVEAGEVTDGIDFTLSPEATRTRLFIDPRLTAVRLGETGRFAVAVADVENLAAFEVTLDWDPDVVRVDAVEVSDFLARTGRRIVPLDPIIDNEAGRLQFAAATIGSAPGVSGDGPLFHVSFTGHRVGGTVVGIGPSVLTTPRGEPIAHEAAPGRIAVGECMVGDFDCNCVIDILDVMAVVRRWGTIEGDPDYDRRFDMDDDGDIDIVDVQIEASLWGKRCDREPEPVTPGRQAPRAESAAPDEPDPEAPTGPSVALSAQPSELGVGEQVVVTVTIADTGEVAGFELHATFDPSRLRFVESAVGEFMTGTGRTVVPLGPDGSDGAVTFGAFSLPGKPAPTGGGQLATLTFEALAPGTSQVEVTRAVTVDPYENDTALGGGRVTIGVAGPAAPAALVPFAISGG